MRVERRDGGTLRVGELVGRVAQAHQQRQQAGLVGLGPGVAVAAEPGVEARAQLHQQRVQRGRLGLRGAGREGALGGQRRERRQGGQQRERCQGAAHATGRSSDGRGREHGCRAYRRRFERADTRPRKCPSIGCPASEEEGVKQHLSTALAAVCARGSAVAAACKPEPG
ncbi:MAG: hypothetical protein DRQ55_06420 [Planctomycetota bacterium]|nr:MAG: hypothetical protein DRQ55_06420 [Planctomycetota bacterium]